jgi:hypothetical protein
MSITFIKIAMPLFLTRKIGEFRNKNVFFYAGKTSILTWLPPSE